MRDDDGLEYPEGRLGPLASALYLVRFRFKFHITKLLQSNNLQRKVCLCSRHTLRAQVAAPLTATTPMMLARCKRSKRIAGFNQ